MALLKRNSGLRVSNKAHFVSAIDCQAVLQSVYSIRHSMGAVLPCMVDIDGGILKSPDEIEQIDEQEHQGIMTFTF